MKKISTQRVLLVPRKELSKYFEKHSDVESEEKIPLKDMKSMAVRDVDLETFFQYINVDSTSTEFYYFMPYDTSEDYIFAQMGEHDDSLELVVNNHAEFHIRREDNAYSVDVYKYFPQDSDHDFDRDDVWTMGYVLDDDIDSLVSQEDEDEE